MTRVRYEDGTMYEGQVHAQTNQRHGMGELKDARGNLIYKGKWADNLKAGFGKYVFLDQFQQIKGPGIVRGEWKNDQCVHERCRVTLRDGSVFTWNRARQAWNRLSVADSLDFMREELCDKYHDPENRKLFVRWAAKDAGTVVAAMLRQALEDQRAQCAWLSEVALNRDQLPPQDIRKPTPEGLLEVGSAVELVFRQNVDELILGANIRRRNRHFGPAKSLKRVLEKIGENQGMLRVFDLNRAEIICENKQQFNMVGWNIGIIGNVIRVVNKFLIDWENPNTPPCLLYNLALNLPETHPALRLLGNTARWVVEVQVTLPIFLTIKNRCHAIYEISRVTQLPDLCPVCQGCAPSARDWWTSPALRPIPGSVETGFSLGEAYPKLAEKMNLAAQDSILFIQGRANTTLCATILTKLRLVELSPIPLVGIYTDVALAQVMLVSTRGLKITLTLLQSETKQDFKFQTGDEACYFAKAIREYLQLRDQGECKQ